MNWQDANAVIRLIHGEFLWCGVPVTLVARHRTKKEAKYDLDATFTYRHTRAQERVALSKFRKDSKRSIINPKEPQPRGQGMTRWADKYFAKRLAGGLVQERSAHHASARSRTGIIWPKSPRILTTKPRRNYKMASPKKNLWLNLTILTPARSGLAALPFIASAAQQRIGTEKELEGD